MGSGKRRESREGVLMVQIHEGPRRSDQEFTVKVYGEKDQDQTEANSNAGKGEGWMQ